MATWSTSSSDRGHRSSTRVGRFHAEKITDIWIEDNTLVYLTLGMNEFEQIHDNYKKWKTATLEDISKGTYRSRIDVLLKNKMPNIDLKNTVDEFESKSETSPHEW